MYYFFENCHDCFIYFPFVDRNKCLWLWQKYIRKYPLAMPALDFSFWTGKGSQSMWQGKTYLWALSSPQCWQWDSWIYNASDIFKAGNSGANGVLRCLRCVTYKTKNKTVLYLIVCHISVYCVLTLCTKKFKWTPSMDFQHLKFVVCY